MARNRYDMDEVLEEGFDISQLKRLAGYVSPYKGKMAGIIVLMLSASALTMMVPIFFSENYGLLYPAEGYEENSIIQSADTGCGLLFRHCHAF